MEHKPHHKYHAENIILIIIVLAIAVPFISLLTLNPTGWQVLQAAPKQTSSLMVKVVIILFTVIAVYGFIHWEK